MKLRIICFFSLFLALIIGSVYANEESSVQITSDKVNVQLSDMSSQVIAQLKSGETINVLSNSGKLLKINYGDNLEGYIDSSTINGNSYTGIAGLDPRLDAIVKLAWARVGSGRTEPNWGDEWENHFYTCNGFVGYLYLHIYDEARGTAINLPINGFTQDNFCTVRYDAKQLKELVQNGAKLDDYLKPGDLIYTHGTYNWYKAGHVEMYVGNEQMIGAGGSRPDSVRVNNVREKLLSGELHLICRVIDGNNINTEMPTSQIRPLRKFPPELNINLYDYDALQRQGITVVEDNAKRNLYMK